MLGGVFRYMLSTSDGFQVSLIDYGAGIQSIRQLDERGQTAEITLGYDTLQGNCRCRANSAVSFLEYIDDPYYFGCTVGRVTNRIKNGRFQLDGVDYQLEKNDQGKHHLHGVFNKRLWTGTTENDDTVVFKYCSPDGTAFPLVYV